MKSEERRRSERQGNRGAALTRSSSPHSHHSSLASGSVVSSLPPSATSESSEDGRRTDDRGERAEKRVRRIHDPMTRILKRQGCYCTALCGLSPSRSRLLTCHSSPYSRVSRVNDGPVGDERRETPRDRT